MINKERIIYLGILTIIGIAMVVFAYFTVISENYNKSEMNSMQGDKGIGIIIANSVQGTGANESTQDTAGEEKEQMKREKAYFESDENENYGLAEEEIEEEAILLEHDDGAAVSTNATMTTGMDTDSAAADKGTRSPEPQASIKETTVSEPEEIKSDNGVECEGAIGPEPTQASNKNSMNIIVVNEGQVVSNESFEVENQEQD